MSKENLFKTVRYFSLCSHWNGHFLSKSLAYKTPGTKVVRRIWRNIFNFLWKENFQARWLIPSKFLNQQYIFNFLLKVNKISFYILRPKSVQRGAWNHGLTLKNVSYGNIRALRKLAGCGFGNSFEKCTWAIKPA